MPAVGLDNHFSIFFCFYLYHILSNEDEYQKRRTLAGIYGFIRRVVAMTVTVAHLPL